jgi:hypothetical protein
MNGFVKNVSWRPAERDKRGDANCAANAIPAGTCLPKATEIKGTVVCRAIEPAAESQSALTASSAQLDQAPLAIRQTAVSRR